MLNPNVHAVLINTPNNPSGIVYSTETIKKLASVLEKKQEEYGHEIFILSDDAPETIYEIVGPPSEEFEKVQIYKNVIFWTFDRKKYQKCNWWKKTASNGIADKLTIRTANTVKKVCKSNSFGYNRSQAQKNSGYH